MPIHRGVMGASVTELPIAIIGAVTNFNQDRATFNAIVSANYQSTTVKFQYNTTNDFAHYTEVTAVGSPLLSQAVAAYFNVTGLSINTTYYVRAVVSNSIGTTTTSSVSFTTWSLKTYLNTTAGSYTVSVPSITPTGDSAIAPTIYEMLIYGGGGGANYSGGGGGGYRIASTKLSSDAGTQNITGTIGAGGAGGNGGGGAGGGTAGGATTLAIGNTTYTANGGGVANWLTNGGASGSGDNPSRAGGTGNYGYTYFTGNYVQVVVGYNNYCCATDKFGICTQYCPDYNSPIYGNDTNQPIYATDYNRYAGGGGGGTDTAGTNAIYPDGGGNGGNGGGAYGLNGGNGGLGGGTASFGSNGTVVAGGVVVGTGGAGWFGAGLAGGITFKYYGP